MRGLFFFSVISLVVSPLHATHNRAGEITYTRIAPLTYEVRIVTYTNALSPVDRCQLKISWGDDTFSEAKRINGQKSLRCEFYSGEIIQNNIRKNVYTARHTYSRVGTYKIFLFDPNRNAAVKNIPNSVNTPFYIEAFLVIDPFLGGNNSPQVLAPPINQGVVGVPFRHSISAYDIDGDSLRYEIVNCKGTQGQEITSTYTSGQGNLSLETLSVDENGTITWDKPTEEGIYNIAVKVLEYRKTDKGFFPVGSIVRDMQIEILKSANQPPQIQAESYQCVEAGKEIKFDVSFSDPDGDNLGIYSYGGVYLLENKAAFITIKDTTSPVKLPFLWQTSFENSRLYPYKVTFEAIDQLHKNLHTDGSQPQQHLHGLSNSKVVSILLVSPPPKILEVKRVDWEEKVRVAWEKYVDTNAIGYEVYRTLGNTKYTKDPCNRNFFSAGFTKVGEVTGRSNTEFDDTNLGQPFQKEKAYFYAVVAKYTDRPPSYPSEFHAVTLVSPGAALEKVSVKKTSISSGEVDISWKRVSQFPEGTQEEKIGYLLEHRSASGVFEKIETKSSLADTTFVHQSVDTYQKSNTYRISLVDLSNNNTPLYYGTFASSYFTQLEPTNKKIQVSFQENVPWQTDSIYVYRETKEPFVFEKVGVITDTLYTDKQLNNGQEYCYKLKVFGSYSDLGVLINESQINCASPIDNIVECVPQVSSHFDCKKNIYKIEWDNAALKCSDIVSYEIQTAPKGKTNFHAVKTLSKEEREYHIEVKNINHCFRVIAIDDKNNRSMPGKTLCADPCPSVSFPNVFTPNADGVNDFFIPIGLPGLQALEIQIYDHLGRLIFDSDEVDFRWGGSDKQGSDCPVGVYFYFSKTRRTLGQETLEATHEGFVHILR